MTTKYNPMTTGVKPVAVFDALNHSVSFADGVAITKRYVSFYDQQAIDDMRADVDSLRALLRALLPMFDAARPLVLNYEKVKDAVLAREGKED